MQKLSVKISHRGWHRALIVSISLLVGFSLAVSGFSGFLNNRLVWSDLTGWQILGVGGATLIGAAMAFVITRPLLAAFKTHLLVRWWTLSAFVIAIILLTTEAVQIPTPVIEQHLVVEATGQKHPNAQGSEVWLVALERGNGDVISPETMQFEGDWRVNDDVIMTTGQQQASASWTGTTDTTLALVLISHPWSGVIDITWNGETQSVDLYQEAGPPRTISLEPRLHLPVTVTFVYYMAYLVSLTVLLGWGGGWLFIMVDRLVKRVAPFFQRWIYMFVTTWGLSGIIGASGVLLYFYSATNFQSWSLAHQVMFGLYFWAVFTMATAMFIFYFTWPRLAGWSASVGVWWLTLAILGGILWSLSYPVTIAYVPATHHLEITATGKKNPLSQGTVVQLRGYPAVDATTPTVILEGERFIDSDLPFTFELSPQAGIVAIQWNDHYREIDLYSATGLARNIILPASVSMDEGMRWLQVARGVLWGSLLFVVSVWAVTLAIGRNPPVEIKPQAPPVRYAPLWPKVFWGGSILVVLASFPMALVLTPWFGAVQTNVRLYLTAPSQTDIEICWYLEQTSCLPLVPVLESSTLVGQAEVWIAELPPRPQYNLSVVFPNGATNVTFQDLRLGIRQDTSFVYIHSETTDEFTLVDAQLASPPLTPGLIINPGGELRLETTIEPLPVYSVLGAYWVTIWVLLSGAGILALALLLLLARPNNYADHLPHLYQPQSTAPWLILSVAGTSTLILLLIVGSTTILPGGDAIEYLIGAISFIDNGFYYSGNIRRFPGYPLFLSFVIYNFGYSLRAIVILQGLLIGTGILALILSLRHQSFPGVFAFVAGIAILSPVQVYHSRIINTESVYTAFCLLTLACFFYHLKARGYWSYVWLLLYAIFMVTAVLIRPNGIVLAVAPLVVYIPKMIHLLFVQRETWQKKALLLIQETTPYVLVAAFLLTGPLVWSVRNYVIHDYLTPNNLGVVSSFVAQIKAGSFEIESIHPSRFDIPGYDGPVTLYELYILSRYNSSLSWYDPWTIYRELNSIVQQVYTEEHYQTQDQIMDEMTEASKSRSPWPMTWVSHLRVGWWATALMQEEQNYMNQGADLAFRLDHPQINRQQLLNTNYYFREYVNPHVQINDGFRAAYSNVTEYYSILYRISVVLATMSALYVLWRGYPALAIPFFVVFANIVLYIILLQLSNRYVLVFDVLLFCQIAIGLSLLVDHWRTPSLPPASDSNA